MSKISRQTKIKEILQHQHIGSQEELVEILKSWDMEVTQATLSRDFNELGVVRIHQDGKLRYTVNQLESGVQVRKLISFEIINVSHNESMVVLRTLAGRANGVAYFIDRLEKKEILGTVAGDDTVLIIPNTHRNIPVIVQIIKQMMHDEKDTDE